MRHIKINGVEYPFKLALTPLRKYEAKFNKSFSEVGDSMKVDEMLSIVYFGVECGCRIEGRELKLDYETLSDTLEMKDLTELVKIAFEDLIPEGGGEGDPKPKESPGTK
jgi:hypothetical protein